MARIDPNDVKYIVKTYHNDILGFVKDVLKVELDDWQVDFLVKCQNNPRISVRAGNSIGKSFAVGCLALWMILTQPGALVIMVANSEAQVKERTLRTCADIARKSIVDFWFDITATKISLITDPSSYIGYAVASKTNPDAVKGFHSKSFLLILDEAQAIDNEIYQALETTVASENSKFVMIGNPSRLGTNFHKSFYENSKYWMTLRVDSRFCKHSNKEHIQRIIEEHGLDSDYVRVSVLGEFPKQSSDQFFSSDIFRFCQGYQCPEEVYKKFPVILGVDIARGGADKSVICVRQGRKVHSFIKFDLDDLFQVSTKVAEVFNQWQAKLVVVDATGIGAGVVDILKNSFLQPFQVIEKQFAGKSSDSSQYANVRQELWITGRQKLKSGISIPHEYIIELIRETEGIEYYLDSKNRIFVESKEDMKRRGLQSPDMTDALFLALSTDPAPKIEVKKDDPDAWINDLQYTSRRSGGSGWMST